MLGAKIAPRGRCRPGRGLRDPAQRGLVGGDVGFVKGKPPFPLDPQAHHSLPFLGPDFSLGGAGVFSFFFCAKELFQSKSYLKHE